MKFAQMEMRWGEHERFTSLFENIINNFPKRTDVWSVYIDQLTKDEKYEAARYASSTLIIVCVLSEV